MEKNYDERVKAHYCVIFLGAKKWTKDETKANSMVVGKTNDILHRRSLIISNGSLGLIWGKSFTKAIFIGLPLILTHFERSIFSGECNQTYPIILSQLTQPSNLLSKVITLANKEIWPVGMTLHSFDKRLSSIFFSI